MYSPITCNNLQAQGTGCKARPSSRVEGQWQGLCAEVDGEGAGGEDRGAKVEGGRTEARGAEAKAVVGETGLQAGDQVREHMICFEPHAHAIPLMNRVFKVHACPVLLGMADVTSGYSD